MIEKTTGIVLRTVKYSDASNIVEMYTERLGRTSFLVPVLRNRKTMVRSVLFQPLSLLEVVYEERSTTRLHRIKEVKMMHPFVTILYNPYKISIAMFLAEFLCRALHEGEENVPLYAYLHHSILWLDESLSSCANFHLVFLMRFSRFVGLYPNLEDYKEGDFFDLMNSCFVALRPLHPFVVHPVEASRLRLLMRMNYETMHLFTMNRMERARCLDVLNEYYRLHIPDFPELRSLQVLKELFD